MRAQDLPARDRLLAKLAPQPNGCWHWTGVIDSKGYGHVGYKGRRGETVQRAVYDCFVGPIPDGHEIDHQCHNDDETCIRLGAGCLHRRCGNPAHLRPLVRVANSRAAKQRVTACPHDHPYDDENTRLVGGRRFCRTCQRAASQAAKARAKASA